MFDLFGIKKRKLEAAKLAEEKEKCDALKANLEPRITNNGNLQIAYDTCKYKHRRNI